jgi:FtsH-binding integral membrane protein
MKIGKLEGTPEEIKDFFQNSGLNVSDYLEKTEQPLKPVCFIAPVIIVIAALLWLTLFAPSRAALQTFLFLCGCGGGIWLAATIQIRFKNTWASIFVAVGTVLVMMVAIGIATPADIVKQLKELKK